MLTFSTQYPYNLEAHYFTKAGMLPLGSLHTIYMPLVLFSLIYFKTQPPTLSSALVTPLLIGHLSCYGIEVDKK